MRAPADPLSATFFALADPTRRAILARLASGAATVKELTEPFEMSGPAVSKHLRVLERAGLIHRGREAQSRPRTLAAAPLRDVAAWAGEFRRFWDASYARLDAYLGQLARQEHANDDRTAISADSVRNAQRPRRRRDARRKRAARRRV
jgi:DNA-binding transcriptional ArsR family regulator